MTLPIGFKELNALLPGQVKANEPMARHTTWRIGGPADIFVEPAGVKELARLVTWVHGRDLPLYFIGNGSNLLVKDGGIRGIVVKIGRAFGKVQVQETTLIAGAGAMLGVLAAAAQKSGVGGLEFATGIPGTVGGAVVMNAGANGSSMADLVQEVMVMDLSGELERRNAGELGFGYRTSNLLGSSLVVLEVTCRGVARDPDQIRADMEQYLARRRASQPLSYPSAGSVFKNPPGKTAGWLIEQAGCKGMRQGDAQVSLVHANFIVNLGRATARDVQLLIHRVQQLVYERFGITLTLEVQVLGED
ncbi:UDP-N-acetylmuramate dehydrogenase [Desulfofundulus thermosubterraneus]|uniref:UDP-N-acetylenolpyruvoylglucosamine reductase n=1 Tax=Desulfofundulus thermosubterraneus DSM 16057 TaxID=1121432 RepID=A0A1M6CCY3_9FIRM|nr:UDP-N-acetylmuramate dehydrogenase [Desulfofundulus thermosubterraneus]SHI58857.1 UDP-N-acetylmuramate dehydrogenase [Desulfofundulus thermosubterraneus DSM 16057]